MTSPRHVTHVITGLGLGGAEMMLYKVLAAMDRDRDTAEVISLTDADDLRPRIEALGVPVTSLGMSGAASTPGAWLSLRRLLTAHPGDVVQTWMYHADLLGGLAARTVGRPVVWDIQGSNLDPASTRAMTRRIVGWCASLSHRLPARIIACGHSTARTHVALGYDASRVVVIPNAVDADAFRPDPEARARVRAELGIPAEAFVVGMGARLDPQKDHGTMFDAWGRVTAAREGQAHLLLFGRDLVAEQPQVAAWMQASGARGAHLLGPRHDVPAVFAACDVGCLSSAYGEGLPNIVAEAMATGLPCVVTDVGDSAWVVGDTGAVVPPRDAIGFAAALDRLAAMPRGELAALGGRARARVAAEFEIRAVAAQYYAIYRTLASS